MNFTRSYIIVDDDPFSNILCCMVIKTELGEVDTETFTVPEEGLAFIKNVNIDHLKPTILFLDINMPTLSGWEFMEEFEKFTEAVKKQISVYILSSSVDERDKIKAESNKYIKGFISKPLDAKAFLSIAIV